MGLVTNPFHINRKEKKWIAFGLRFALILAIVILIAYVYEGIEYVRLPGSYSVEQQDDFHVRYKMRSDSIDKALHLSIHRVGGGPVISGGKMTFTLLYTGDIAECAIDYRCIGLKGFYAHMHLSQSSKNPNVVTLELPDIKTDDYNSEKSVGITGGTAINQKPELANSAISPTFKIYKLWFFRLLDYVFSINGASITFVSLLTTLLLAMMNRHDVEEKVKAEQSK